MVSHWKLHAVLMTGMLAIWNGILVVLTFKWLWNSITNKYIRNLAVMQSVCFCVSFGFASIGGSYEYGSKTFFIFYIVFALFLCLGVLAMYLSIILRLKLTFDDSVYVVSKMTLYSYYTIIVICGILGIISFILFGEAQYTLFVAFLAVSVIFFIAGDIHIAYLFNKKLFALVLNQRQSLYVGNRGGGSTDSTITLSDHQLSMIKIVSKLTVIQIIGILSLLVPVCFSAFVTAITIKESFSYGLISFIWGMFIGLILTTYSIFLSFNAMDKCYFRSYGKCHKFMKQCCVGLAEKEIAKKYEEGSKYKPPNVQLNDENKL
eukprot:32736_1